MGEETFEQVSASLSFDDNSADNEQQSTSSVETQEDEISQLRDEILHRFDSYFQSVDYNTSTTYEERLDNAQTKEELLEIQKQLEEAKDEENTSEEQQTSQESQSDTVKSVQDALGEDDLFDESNEEESTKDENNDSEQETSEETSTEENTSEDDKFMDGLSQLQQPTEEISPVMEDIQPEIKNEYQLKNEELKRRLQEFKESVQMVTNELDNALINEVDVNNMTPEQRGIALEDGKKLGNELVNLREQFASLYNDMMVLSDEQMSLLDAKSYQTSRYEMPDVGTLIDKYRMDGE